MNTEERDTRTFDATTELMVRKAEAAEKLVEMEARVEARPQGARFSDFYRAEAEARELAEQDEMDSEPHSDAYWAEQELDADAPTVEEELDIVLEKCTELFTEACYDLMAGERNAMRRLARVVTDALSPYTDE